MTTNAWDRAKSLSDKHTSSGGIFIRLANDGDKVVGVFCGEPYAREVHWNGERYEECAGPDTRCPACAEGKKPSLRVAMNFYVPAERAMKVIEGGSTWFKDLFKCRDKYGLESWTFEVERHGAAGDPKTTYTILPDEKLTDEQRAEIANVQLHDLPRVVSGGSDEGTSEFGSCDRDNKAGAGGAIAPARASELAARLKALPRDAVDNFLQKFRVQRIRDLRAGDEKAAVAFVESLERASRAPARDGGEIDPFA